MRLPWKAFTSARLRRRREVVFTACAVITLLVSLCAKVSNKNSGTLRAFRYFRLYLVTKINEKVFQLRMSADSSVRNSDAKLTRKTRGERVWKIEIQMFLMRLRKLTPGKRQSLTSCWSAS